MLEQLEKMRSFLKSIDNEEKASAIRCALTVYLLAAPVVALCCGSLAGAGLLAAIGAAASILTRLPDVSLIEMMGFKAKLERQVKEVEVTSKQIKRMSLAFAACGIDQVAMSGQMFISITSGRKSKIRDDIIESLEALGVSKEEILEAQKLWIELWSRTIVGRIDKLIRPTIEKGLPKDDPNIVVDPVSNLPEAGSLRKWIERKHGPISKDVRKLLSMLEDMQKTGKLSNPEEFGSGEIGPPDLFVPAPTWDAPQPQTDV